MKTEPREVWVQRVQRLADSGLTAKEFASEIGVNSHTLAGWRWRLTRDAGARSPVVLSAKPPKFVDVTSEFQRAKTGAAVSLLARDPFELVLTSGLRIRVPSAFDPLALRSLISALEAR